MRAITLAVAIAFSMSAAAQTPQPSPAASLYQSVISGKRSIESLSPRERAMVLLMAKSTGSICESNSTKCRAVCQAADELEAAATDLSRCASSHDYNDSCDSRFNDVRDAHDELESAVSDAAGDCE